MVKFLAISLSLLAFVQVMAGAYSDAQIEEIVKNSGEGSDIYTTHSETHRPIHVPVFERYPINVPHPEPIAVPQYIRVPIPQPYPKYEHVQHRIEIPVYKIIPEIIEKPVPYTVEKPYPVEIEKPFPVEVVKKLEIPVPKPYPVHMIYYKHISEDDPPPKATKNHGFTQMYYNKYNIDEDFQKILKASQVNKNKPNNSFEENFFKNSQVETDNELSYDNDDDLPSKFPKFLGKTVDFPTKNLKFLLKGNSKLKIVDKDFLKAMKHFYASGGRIPANEDSKPAKHNEIQLSQLTDESFPSQPVIIFNGRSNKFPVHSKSFHAKNQNSDDYFPYNQQKVFYGFTNKSSKQQNLKSSGKFSPESRHEHRFNGY